MTKTISKLLYEKTQILKSLVSHISYIHFKHNRPPRKKKILYLKIEKEPNFSNTPAKIAEPKDIHFT